MVFKIGLVNKGKYINVDTNKKIYFNLKIGFRFLGFLQ